MPGHFPTPHSGRIFGIQYRFPLSEAALIQPNSRCGGVAARWSVGLLCRPKTRAALARSHLHLNKCDGSASIPHYVSVCLRKGMAQAAGRLCPTKRNARGKKCFQIWLNVTAFDACIHSRSPGGRHRGHITYLHQVPGISSDCGFGYKLNVLVTGASSRDAYVQLVSKPARLIFYRRGWFRLA